MWGKSSDTFKGWITSKKITTASSLWRWVNDTSAKSAKLSVLLANKNYTMLLYLMVRTYRRTHRDWPTCVIEFFWVEVMSLKTHWWCIFAKVCVIASSVLWIAFNQMMWISMKVFHFCNQKNCDTNPWILTYTWPSLISFTHILHSSITRCNWAQVTIEWTP